MGRVPVYGDVTVRNQAIEVLNCAADKIEQVGWTRGHFEKRIYQAGEGIKTVAYCAVGAVRACSDATNLWPVRTYALDALSMELEERYGEAEVPIWNDTMARDRRQVAAALRRTARKIGKAIQ